MDWEIISYKNDKFNELMQQYEAAIKIIKTKLELIDQELNFKYGHSSIHGIQYRIKSMEIGYIPYVHLPVHLLFIISISIPKKHSRTSVYNKSGNNYMEVNEHKN